MLTTRIAFDAREAEALRREWHDLVLRAPRGELVMTPTWLLAWWHEFGARDGRSLRLVTFRDEDRLVGLAPLSFHLELHRHAIPVRRLALLGNGEDERDEVCSDYAGLVCDAGYEDAIARELARLLADERGRGAAPPVPRWDELLLPLMSADDPMIAHLQRAFERLGLRSAVAETGRAAYIALPKTWEEYLAQLEGSSRYLVTRAVRELDKWAGAGATLHRASTPEELAEGRRILRALHTERWGEAGQAGMFASARWVRFHDEVMPQFFEGKDAELDLLWLTVKGEAVACLYNIVFRGKVYFYQAGRKVEGVPKALKLGIATHALAIRRSIEQGRREYDFLNGASQYKLKLSTATRPLVTLRAVAPTIRARAVEGARNVTDAVLHKAREKLAARRQGKGAAEPRENEPDGR